MSGHHYYVEPAQHVPTKAYSEDKLKKAAKKPSAKGTPSRRAFSLKRALKRCVIAGIILLTLLTVALLWRPAGADERYLEGGIAAIVFQPHNVSAGVDYANNGHTEITLSDIEIATIGNAALTGNSSYGLIPPSAVIREDTGIPDWIETVSGCRFEDGTVTIFVRCRALFSAYATITGVLSADVDGRLLFNVLDLRLGLIPCPKAILQEADAFVLMDPYETNVFAEEVETSGGRLRIKLREL